MAQQAEVVKRYEVRIRPLGLMVGFGRGRIWVRRCRPEGDDIRERAEQWFRYCQSVHRR